MNTKYRVFDFDIKQMCDVSSIDFELGLASYYVGSTKKTIPLSHVMQSTNLFDVNGKELYIGDIVEMIVGFSPIRCVVVDTHVHNVGETHYSDLSNDNFFIISNKFNQKD